ncbi:ankyrin repeat-containing protein [Gossypium australe]|uniref:Ankyrin repeat-containing protein n=1 Tax=Gossypium australe TaxID=47621 RepID=A0A5B6WJ91_9ROSI|nr:ankyrin repeat-containing protein [Gossypium australe]
MRNTFLVVTVLIITATYTATLNPPKQPDTISNSQNFHLKYDASLGSNRTGPAPSPPPTEEEKFKNILDVSAMFWLLYYTLTFWAATVLTAYLLPSRSICLFILITLSLFGTCYMLLVAVSIRTLALEYSFTLSTPGSVSYPSLSIINYCLATVLALVTLYRTSYYMLYRFVPKRRFFLLLQVVSLCIFAVSLQLHHQFAMEKAIIAFNLWEVVNSDVEPVSLRANPTMAQIRQHTDERTKRHKVMSCIQNSVSDVIFTRIMACESPNDFKILKIKEEEIVKQYLDRIMAIVNSIRLLGDQFSEARIIEKVISTLPERYEAKISSLEDREI